MPHKAIGPVNSILHSLKWRHAENHLHKEAYSLYVIGVISPKQADASSTGPEWGWPLHRVLPPPIKTCDPSLSFQTIGLFSLPISSIGLPPHAGNETPGPQD